MKWTISNQLTVGRVLLIPLFIVAFYLPGTIAYYLSALVFTIAALTDWLDGYLARSRNEETAFGRFLDPVADKLLVASALVLLVADERAPAILAIIIIGREIAIGALREWLAERASIVKVSLLGKWKTMIQMLAIGSLLIHNTLYGFNFHLVGVILLWLAAILTLWSAYEYMHKAWPELVRKPESNGKDAKPVQVTKDASE